MRECCLIVSRQTGLGVGGETEDISGRKFPLVKGWVLGNIQWLRLNQWQICNHVSHDNSIQKEQLPDLKFEKIILTVKKKLYIKNSYEGKGKNSLFIDSNGW